MKLDLNFSGGQLCVRQASGKATTGGVGTEERQANRGKMLLYCKTMQGQIVEHSTYGEVKSKGVGVGEVTLLKASDLTLSPAPPVRQISQSDSLPLPPS